MTQNLINADSVSENIDEISLTTGFVLCKKKKKSLVFLWESGLGISDLRANAGQKKKDVSQWFFKAIKISGAS